MSLIEKCYRDSLLYLCRSDAKKKLNINPKLKVADRDGEIVEGGLHDLAMGPNKRGNQSLY